MSIGCHKIRNQKEVHFLTLTVVDWVDVFTKKPYRNLVVYSLTYCCLQKSFLLHAWCIMSNHLHLLGSSKGGILSDVIRDFKTFTSKQIVKLIEGNKTEHRRDWMLERFYQKGINSSRNQNHQFWLQDNAPMECYSPEFTWQRLNYIHQNPVRAGIVERAEDYLYSSARSYKLGKDKGLVPVSFI